MEGREGQPQAAASSCAGLLCFLKLLIYYGAVGRAGIFLGQN